MSDELGTHDYFACRCSKESAEECDWLLEEVKRLLVGGSEELLPSSEVNDANLLSHVVISLQWDYRAEITGIYNDQWSVVVSATTDVEESKADADHPYQRVNPPVFSTWIQCDSVGPPPPINGKDFCHDGTPFLTVVCSCGSGMHLHKSQLDALPSYVEIVESTCKGCGNPLELSLSEMLQGIRESWGESE
jgi:hypothetical protein